MEDRSGTALLSRLQLAVVIALSTVAALPLFLPGFVDTHAYGDSPFVLLRLIELDRGLREGVWFPRWAPDFAYGYGYPFFNYYASLAYYLAEAFHLLGLGIVASVEAAFFVGFLLAGVGMYLFARDVFGGTAAVLVSAAYTYAPFHLANVYLRGDALAEFSAYGLFPIVLWAFRRLAYRRSLHCLAAAGASYGALMFTHNISALLFTGLLAAYVIVLVVTSVRDSEGAATGQIVWPASLLVVGLAAALGLALAAFFWVPALSEQSYVQLEHLTTGYFDFHGHFLDLGQLVSPELIYNYNLDGHPESGLPFHLGLAQAALVAVSLLLAILHWARARLKPCAAEEGSTFPRAARWHVGFFAMVFIALAFLMCPYSTWVWEGVPLLPMVQFPWRLLSLAGLSGSLVCGFLVRPLANRRRLSAVVLALVVAAMAFSATLRLAPERMYLDEADLGPQRIFEYEYVTSSIGTTCRYEYLPRWVGDRPWSSATAASYPETTVPTVVDSGGAQVEVLESSGYRKVLQTDSAVDTTITLGSFYFPGWTAKVDGRDAEVSAAADSGLTRVVVPSGSHRVEVSFGATRRQELAAAVSAWAVGVLALLIVLGVWSRYRWPARDLTNWSGLGSAPPRANPQSPVPSTASDRWAIVAPAFVVVALASVWLGVQSGRPAERGGAVPSDLQTLSADVHSPLAHHHPNGIPLTDGWRFEGYEVSSWKVAPPARLNLKLYWRGEPAASGDVSVMARLVSPANLVLQRKWSYSDSVVTSIRPTGSAGLYQSEHEIPVAEATPPGLYFVEIVLDRNGRAASALGSFGQATDRTPLLGPFVVQRTALTSSASDESGNRLAEFGGMLALVSEQARLPQGASDGLTVSLEWLALKRMPISYRASLRLVDAAGGVWGYSDGQMVDGLYPTSVWSVGERVRDLRELTPLPGTPPGDYYVELRVYQPSNQQTLEVVDAEKRVSALARLGPIKLTRVQRPEAAGDWQLSDRLEMKCPGGLELVGCTVQNDQVREGEDLLVTLGWLAQSRLTTDYAVSMQLVDGQGAVKAEAVMPLSAGYPSSSWQPGDFVRGQCALRVPPGVATGEYRVRLALDGRSDCSPSETWLPAKVRVEARARQFVPPVTANPLDVRFASVGRLVGYDIDDGAARPGGTVGLTLHWQALGPTNRSYKVFVHLVGGDGRIWGQRDDFPAQGTKPTSSWLKGEYVEDAYTIPIDPGAPTGEYQLLVGLYDLGSGQRLPVVGDEDQTLGDHTVLTRVRLE